MPNAKKESAPNAKEQLAKKAESVLRMTAMVEPNLFSMCSIEMDDVWTGKQSNWKINLKGWSNRNKIKI